MKLKGHWNIFGLKKIEILFSPRLKTKGLNMIFVPVKKKFELHPFKKKYLKKVPDPTLYAAWQLLTVQL